VAALDILADPVTLARRFDEQLERRAGPIDRYWEYYRGEAQVIYATAKYRQHFARLLNEISDNWCEVVIDSAVERLRVTGFRFGETSELGDDQAWAIWQHSSLDADQVEAHEEACVSSLCYLLIDPPGEEDLPRISPLSPLEAITLNAPEDRRRRLAGYRRFVDEAGIPEARLYLPDRTLVLFGNAERVQAAPLGADATLATSAFGQWQVVDEQSNDAGVVPMVEMVNKSHLGRGGGSDLDPVLSKQDAINKLVCDMMVNSEFGAFAQRWATGISEMIDATGHPIPPEQFLAGPSSLFISENDAAKFGAFPISDGGAFVRMIEMVVQHIAAQTRTPPHYLTAGLGQWPSADSLRASEEGLVQKCLRKILGYGESWEEAMRVAFLFLGDEARGKAHALESLWANPYRVPLAQTTDAAVKMRSNLDVPRRAIWRLLGASPQEIVQWEAELERERAEAPPTVSAPAVRESISVAATPEQAAQIARGQTPTGPPPGSSPASPATGGTVPGQ
jgi:SPP1 Gp6-like portal protein